MDELIERLRELEAKEGVCGQSDVRRLAFREAAAALEAAREDAEKMARWAFEARGLLAGWEDISRNNFANLAAEHVDAFAAIDQARGKAGGEVGP